MRYQQTGNLVMRWWGTGGGGEERKANDDANLKVEVKLSDPARKRPM
jgi:hypothetical protein